MATYCTTCGSEYAEGTRFCNQCGAELAAAAAAHHIGDVVNGHRFDGIQWVPLAPPPSGPPPGPTGVNLGTYAAGVLAWDWRGPLKVAGALLATSLLLTIAAGLTMMPFEKEVRYSFSSVVTLFDWIWSSIFGASLTTHASGNYQGVSGHGSASLTALPLTLTVITFAVGLRAFRRATAAYTSLLPVALFVVRTALLTAVPLLIGTWIAGMNLHDIFGTARRCGPDFAQSFQAGTPPVTCSSIGNGLPSGIPNAVHLGVGPSSTQTFFIGFLLVVVVLMGATLARRDLYPGRIAHSVCRILRGPVAGFGWLLVALIPAGWLTFASAYILRSPGRSDGSSALSFHHWMEIISGVFSYAPTIGFAALGLGTWGKYGGSTSVSADFPTANVPSNPPSAHHGISWWADPSSGPGHGMWIVVALAPIVLAFVALMVSRRRRNETPSTTALSVSSWLVSLLVAYPLLNWWTGLSIGGSFAISGQGHNADASGHASTGVALASSTFLVLAYAVVIGVLVLLVRGALTGEAFGAVSHAFRNADAGPRAVDTTYQAGDIVNGHRFDGTQWVPIATPPPSQG